MAREPRQAGELVRAAMAQARALTDAGAEQVAIWGGTLPDEQKAETFLAAWGDHLAPFTWYLYEEVSRLTLHRQGEVGAGLPRALARLERGHLFGVQGHLSLRRDGGTFYWRFIGDRTVTLPDLKTLAGQLFWEANPTKRFAVHRTSYLQWRVRDGRVSTAWRERWGEANVRLHQIHYLDAGTIAFVRYTDFLEEGQHG